MPEAFYDYIYFDAMDSYGDYDVVSFVGKEKKIFAPRLFLINPTIH